jgi:hypothetical protein
MEFIYVIKCDRDGNTTEVVKRPEEKSVARTLMTFFAESSLKTYQTDTDNRFKGIRLLHANGGLGHNPDRPEIYIRHDNRTVEYWHVEKEQVQETEQEQKPKRGRDQKGSI